MVRFVAFKSERVTFPITSYVITFVTGDPTATVFETNALGIDYRSDQRGQDSLICVLALGRLNKES